MGFWNHQEGRYRLFTDKERREYGERKRLQRSRKWNEIWITKTGLKEERNWTDWAIKQFLGEPTKQSGKYRTYHVYRRNEVIAAEKKKAFREWMAKRVERQTRNT